MTINLLLDLDDTLLDTNLAKFLPEYFTKLANHFKNVVPPDLFIKSLLSSTRLMQDNINPIQTLEQVFSDNFYAGIGKERDELSAGLEDFYDNVFPQLGYITNPKPEAIDFVEWAISEGFSLSIATDPLFPRKAILHRLRWAGLDPDKIPFKLISDFQSFHFAKSSTLYYPEFLAHLNWIDEPVLMVGDSIDRDVLPSKASGIPVFWLNSHGENKNSIAEYGGDYMALKGLLSDSKLVDFRIDYKAPDSLLIFLQATPAYFHSIALDMYKKMLFPTKNVDINPETWSITEIVCHLRDIDAEINLNRITNILNKKNYLVTGIETDHWATERNYQSQDLFNAIRDFAKKRMELTRLLKEAPSSVWSLILQHSFLGRISFSELIQIIVDHDRLHIQQSNELIYKKMGSV